MDGQQIEGTHTVLVLDARGRVLSNHDAVTPVELPGLVLRMQAEYVGARVLIDGHTASLVPTGPATPDEALRLCIGNNPDDLEATVNNAKVIQAMLWTTFDRAASVQAWMLQQANGFTKELLDNNRQLADQASAMQARYQDAMQRIDLMATEQRLMEHDMMARRLSRYTIAQNRAEAEAARPREPADNGWIDELIGGVSSFFSAARQPPDTDKKN